MQSKSLTAPKTKAIIPSGVVDSPFVCGAFKPMKHEV
jgi:hypothetical protein